MTRAGWFLVDGVSQLLRREEREAVRGDLAECSESAWRGLHAVAGLVARREASLWADWRPWLAGFGVALPGSFVLMGVSLSVSWRCRQIFAGPVRNGNGFSSWIPLFCCAGLLILWSWAGGFLVGSLSRRTLWASSLLCLLPCLFCFSRYRVESLPKPCLVLFLAPAVWGVWRGLRGKHLAAGAASVLAVAATVLTAIAWRYGGPWIGSSIWGLGWPAWYLAAIAWRREGPARPAVERRVAK